MSPRDVLEVEVAGLRGEMEVRDVGIFRCSLVGDGVMGWWTAGLIPAGEPGADRFLWDIGQP